MSKRKHLVGIQSFVLIRILTFAICLAVTLTVRSADSCRMEKIMPERLPDLTMPRSGHNIFYVNGELTLTGGHTTNFVTTPTAEYFADGEWHLMPMAYSHDNGFAVVMLSGEVLLWQANSKAATPICSRPPTRMGN